MRASCVRREGKGRRPVGLESRELLLPRDPSPVSFFPLNVMVIVPGGLLRLDAGPGPFCVGPG